MFRETRTWLSQTTEDCLLLPKPEVCSQRRGTVVSLRLTRCCCVRPSVSLSYEDVALVPTLLPHEYTSDEVGPDRWQLRS